MSVRKELKGRKLLVASVGLATASYIGCTGTALDSGPRPGGYDGPTGNLLPPPPSDASVDLKPDDRPPPPPSGNLMPPPPMDALPDTKDGGSDADGRPADGDGGGDSPIDLAPDGLPPVGNLLPPPPLDAAPDGAKDAKAVGPAHAKTSAST